MPYNYQNVSSFLSPIPGDPTILFPVNGEIGYCPQDTSINGGFYTIDYTIVPINGTMGYCPQDTSINGGFYTFDAPP